MISPDSIIIIVVSTIGLLQLMAVYKAVENIRSYRALLPITSERLFIRRFGVDRLQTRDPVELQNQPQLEESERDRGVFLLVWQGENCGDFLALLKTINEYLYANRTGVSDYNLVLEMVERRILKYEEQIELLMPIPVYLGLIGTMVGIVFGLNDLEFGEAGLTSLLSEVMYAMMASGFGLLLTVITSGLIYRMAKSSIIQAKGDFLDFLQSRLVPISGTGVSNSLVKLQLQMVGFNEDFGDNISTMSEVMEKVYDNLETEAGLVQKMQDFDFQGLSKNVVQMGNANAKVFESMSKSIEHIAEFKELMGLINVFLKMSNVIVQKGDDVFGSLKKIDVNLAEVAEEIKMRLDQSADLQGFLAAQFQGAERYEAVFNNTVSRVGNTLRKSLDDLENQTKTSLTLLTNLQATEQKALSDAMVKNRLSLGKLAALDDIHKDLKAHTMELTSFKEILRTLIESSYKSPPITGQESLIKAITNTNARLEELVTSLNKRRTRKTSPPKKKGEESGGGLPNDNKPKRETRGVRKVERQESRIVKAANWAKKLIGWG